MTLHRLARRVKRAGGGYGVQVLWVEPLGFEPGVWVVSAWGGNAGKEELARGQSLRRTLRAAARKLER